ncbi:MAG TPA: chloride channel protein [Croceibacterium sp.]|nr:chloride channel protein [Croceibacterium sp.]
MQPARMHLLRANAVRLRRRLRESEAAFIGLAAIVGLAAGVATNLIGLVAHLIQHLFYGVAVNRLSAIGSIHHPWKLLALPLGGLLMVAGNHYLRRRSTGQIDVVEANALHGGRIPWIDNLIVSAQTIVSNGFGASVGLEAAYAQAGGGIASLLGQWFALRRNDLRVLVGAGAGAGIGAAFGAPLAGAFYAFEIVIGAYTPAAIAPVAAATLASAFVTRSLGVEPFLIATTTATRAITIVDYLAYAALGLACALAGIAVMRLVAVVESRVQSSSRLSRWAPVIGGVVLMPLAYLSPQTLSSGHGALHLDLALQPALAFLATVILLKVAASVISLSFGFRGGLFFASMFLGSLLGQGYAELINMGGFGFTLDTTDAALVGMAALSVSIVGGPMTLAMLTIETTHDFALMGVVLTASLLASAYTRERFGYSFSTWRLHLRGSRIRSPRDIGWTTMLTAGRIMRKDWVNLPEALSVDAFRASVPLGSTSKVVVVDSDGHYRGILQTALGYSPDLDQVTPIGSLAQLGEVTLDPSTDIVEMLHRFEDNAADELAVIDVERRVLGVVSENHARRRYFEEMERSQKALYGEAG